MSLDYHQPQQTAATGSTNYICRATGKTCQNATEYGYCTQTVYNNCGAKMRNVTDCHALNERAAERIAVEEDLERRLRELEELKRELEELKRRVNYANAVIAAERKYNGKQ